MNWWHEQHASLLLHVLLRMSTLREEAAFVMMVMFLRTGARATM
jgi:hypothetical protein